MLMTVDVELKDNRKQDINTVKEVNEEKDKRKEGEKG